MSQINIPLSRDHNHYYVHVTDSGTCMYCVHVTDSGTCMYCVHVTDSGTCMYCVHVTDSGTCMYCVHTPVHVRVTIVQSTRLGRSYMVREPSGLSTKPCRVTAFYQTHHSYIHNTHTVVHTHKVIDTVVGSRFVFTALLHTSISPAPYLVTMVTDLEPTIWGLTPGTVVSLPPSRVRQVMRLSPYRYH